MESCSIALGVGYFVGAMSRVIAEAYDRQKGPEVSDNACHADLTKKNTGGSQVNDIAIIESLSANQMTAQVQKITEFQNIIHRNLQERVDYGIIPNTGNKPVLLKAGAEKVIMLMGIQQRYEEVSAIKDYESGMVEYTIKCILYKGDMEISEGLGTCNSKETKYANANVYNIANTVLKMAKKRAQVDAALSVGCLSNKFTQDIDDEDIRNATIKTDAKKVNVSHDDARLISDAQAKRIFAVSKGDKELCKEVIAKFGYSSSSEIRLADYDEIVSQVEAGIAAKAEGKADAPPKEDKGDAKK